MLEVDGETPPIDLVAQQKAIKDVFEDVLEWNYRTPIWGLTARHYYPEWKKRSCKKNQIANVWYNPQNLRCLVMTRAGIDFPESENFKSFISANHVNLTNEDPAKSTVETQQSNREETNEL